MCLETTVEEIRNKLVEAEDTADSLRAKLHTQSVSSSMFISTLTRASPTLVF